MNEDTEDHDRRSQTALGRLAAELRGRGGTAPSRTPEEAWQCEVRELLRRAEAGALETYPGPWGRPTVLHESGAEHAVALADDGNRVLKFTIPCGLGLAHRLAVQWILDKLTQRWRPVLRLERALPSEYLDRLDLANRLFDDDVRLEGIVPLPDGDVSLVTSQQFIYGTTPTRPEVEAYMRSLGFAPVPEPTDDPRIDLHFFNWYREPDGVAVADAKPVNFLKDASGDLYAIDVIPAIVNEPLLLHFHEPQPN